VWVSLSRVGGDPAVGNLTLTGIPICREAIFKRPTKKDFENILKKKDFVETFNGKIKDPSQGKTTIN